MLTLDQLLDHVDSTVTQVLLPEISEDAYVYVTTMTASQRAEPEATFTAKNATMKKLRQKVLCWCLCDENWKKWQTDGAKLKKAGNLPSPVVDKIFRAAMIASGMPVTSDDVEVGAEDEPMHLAMEN